MSDGNPTPLALDGMAAFRGPAPHRAADPQPRGPQCRRRGQRAARPAAHLRPERGRRHDDARLRPAHAATLVARLVSLSGSHVNCAGGYSACTAGSWLTRRGDHRRGANFNGFAQRHGYVFEVPLDRGPTTAPSAAVDGDGALHARGAGHRRSHGASSTRRRTRRSGRGAGFYRFIPGDKRHLAKGGRLQILGIKGSPQYDAREGQQRGKPLRVTWIDIPEPGPRVRERGRPERGVFQQGWRGGASQVQPASRAAGPPADSIFFVSTSGGDAKSGDKNTDGYRRGLRRRSGSTASASRGKLVLHYESPGGEVMDSPDNLTVTPRGGVAAPPRTTPRTRGTASTPTA